MVRRSVPEFDGPAESEKYAVALQHAIEAHCRGEIVPQEIAKDCRHHAGILDLDLLSRRPKEKRKAKK